MKRTHFPKFWRRWGSPAWLAASADASVQTYPACDEYSPGSSIRHGAVDPDHQHRNRHGAVAGGLPNLASHGPYVIQPSLNRSLAPGQQSARLGQDLSSSRVPGDRGWCVPVSGFGR